MVGTQQAERRVLRLTNPELSGIASNTLVANIQIVMPGEIARAHRHSGAALRLIIEGSGGYTVVNGERVPMSPGDLVLTPNWCWHDHANDTDAPMIWLDGLDTPLVRMLEAGFYEEYDRERQEIAAPVNASEWHYPMTEMQAALHRLAASGTADEIVLEYKNRRTGGPVMTTIACYMQLLRPGERTRARRQVCCMWSTGKAIRSSAASGSTGKTRTCSRCRPGRSASTSTAATGRRFCSASATRR